MVKFVKIIGFDVKFGTKLVDWKIMIDTMGLKDFVGPKGKFVMLTVLWLWMGLPEQNHKTLL